MVCTQATFLGSFGCKLGLLQKHLALPSSSFSSLSLLPLAPDAAPWRTPPPEPPAPLPSHPYHSPRLEVVGDRLPEDSAPNPTPPSPLVPRDPNFHPCRLEVVGDRELAFFPGVARGSIYKGFEYESERGAAAARLQYLDLLGSASTAGAAAAPAAAAAGAWERGAAATAAGESRQPGSAAVLAAVPSPSGCDPPEAVSSGGQPAGGRGQQTWRQVEDYINGGPGFFPQDDDGTLLGSPPPGVQVGRVGGRAESASRLGGWDEEAGGRFCWGTGINSAHAAGCMHANPAHAPPTAVTSQPSQRTNWSPHHLAQRKPSPHPQVLATYPERGGAAAALLCTLGQGRAVLCGTHPELHPSWLEPCLASADVGACSDRTARSGSATSSSSNGGRSSNGSRSSSGAGPSSGTAQPTLEAAGPSSSVAMLQEAQPWQSSGGSGSPSGDSSSGDSSARRQDGSGHAAAAAAPPGESGSNGGGSNSDQGQPEVSTREEAAPLEHLQELHARLLANQEERWRYWRGLLVAAGLAAWLRPTEPARGAGDPGS